MSGEMASGTFNAGIGTGVVKGTCVLIEDGQIVYAGPIKGAPPVEGKEMLLSPEDFERLKTHLDRSRH